MWAGLMGLGRIFNRFNNTPYLTVFTVQCSVIINPIMESVFEGLSDSVGMSVDKVSNYCYF